MKMDVPERPCYVAWELSGRRELEITDVNNEYIRQVLCVILCLGGYWSDAGTFDSLLRARIMVEKYRF